MVVQRHNSPLQDSVPMGNFNKESFGGLPSLPYFQKALNLLLWENYDWKRLIPLIKAGPEGHMHGLWH